MLRAVVLISLMLLPTLCFPQQDRVDSLENLIKYSRRDTLKVRYLNELVTALRDRDSKRAMPYALEAMELTRDFKDQRGRGVALENLAWILYRRGDYSHAFLLSAEALKTYESIHDLSGISRCYIHIAAFQYEQKLYPQAIDNFKKAYQLSQQIGDTVTITRSLTNIGFTFVNLEQLDSAKLYGQRALSMSEKTGNLYGVASALRTLGDVAMKERNYPDALKKFEQGVTISVSLKNTFLQTSTLHRIGKLHAECNRPDEALRYLLETIALAKQYDHKDELERTYKLIAEVYTKKHDIAKAFEYQTHYLQIHDSLNDQRNSEQMALMQARFDSEMKETKIQLLTKEAQLKQEIINSQRIWMYFCIGFLSLLGLLALVLFYNYQLKRKANHGLKERNKEIQRQAIELGNLNGTKDKLFSIISHDLRSPLSSLRGLMDLVIQGVLSKEEFLPVARNLKLSLESVQENLDNLLFWAQSQLKGLQVKPESFFLKPLIEDKIKLFLEISRSKDITIIHEVDEEVMVFADKNYLRLVLRNLLANAIKFSTHGGTIAIRIKELADKVEISVSDSGIGMSPDDVAKLFHAETHFSNPGTLKEKGIGIGLLLTKEFIEKNEGSIRVTSELGKGSTFTFTLRRFRAAQMEKAEALSVSSF